jgi:hypothetical protein
MQSRIKVTEDGSAPADTRSPRWSRSQQEELRKILENKWWPFDRADPKVLAYLHRKMKANELSELSDVGEALM